MYFSSPFTQRIFTPIRALCWWAIQRRSWHGLCPHEGYTWVWKLPSIIHHSITIFCLILSPHFSRYIFLPLSPPVFSNYTRDLGVIYFNSFPYFHYSVGSKCIVTYSTQSSLLLDCLPEWLFYRWPQSPPPSSSYIWIMCYSLSSRLYTIISYACGSAEAQIKTRVILTLKFIPFNGAANSLQVARW